MGGRVNGYVWTTPKLKNSDCCVPDITYPNYYILSLSKHCVPRENQILKVEIV